MDIYLIRHADRFEKPLLETITLIGKIQAILLAKWLKGKNIKVIYSSPLTRTQQTAEIINQELHLKIKIDHDLEEIKTSSEELEWSNWKYYAKQRYQDLNYKINDGESVNKLMRRSKITILKIAEKQTDGNIAIITHAEFIKSFLGSLGYKKFLSDRDIIPNASSTIFKYQKGKINLVSLPDDHYLWITKPISILRKIFGKIFCAKRENPPKTM